MVSQRLHHRCDLVFLSRTLNRGQLSLDRFKFWQPTSQLLALDVCMFDAFA
ncbi:DUF645 family protein [Vibrio metoecus]|uniref:DUF645 family protein n=1 Tax=Vibrio metoecus TaxID=1481663 RepID=UPI00272C5B37|nr:DUF645 family protein [Vibrio metoecus]WKY95482.1 DUF645 family protein [Vibrio metoecus]WKY95504.1 DUF645 family protein [Vibrio metoecus]